MLSTFDFVNFKTKKKNSWKRGYNSDISLQNCSVEKSHAFCSCVCYFELRQHEKQFLSLCQTPSIKTRQLKQVFLGKTPLLLVENVSIPQTSKILNHKIGNTHRIYFQFLLKHSSFINSHENLILVRSVNSVSVTNTNLVLVKKTHTAAQARPELFQRKTKFAGHAEILLFFFATIKISSTATLKNAPEIKGESPLKNSLEKRIKAEHLWKNKNPETGKCNCKRTNVYIASTKQKTVTTRRTV